MSKWTKTRHDPGRSYADEASERTERMIARVRKFLEEGIPEDEPEFVCRSERGEAENNGK